MTRGQAIERLEKLREVVENFTTDECLKMAIEALQTEPCGKDINVTTTDAISRSELLKAINTWDKFGCDADTKLVRYKDHYIPYIHYDDVVKCIKSMPSVTAEKEVYSTDAFWKMIDEAVDKMEVE